MIATLSAAAQSMRGELHGTDREFAGVSIDTRTLAPGELFFAIRGPKFDGADFVDKARLAGAAAAVVVARTGEGIAQIEVDDTRLALGRLGAAWRQQQPALVIGITGSNGKTTLKELTAACLSRAAPALATRGNFNNEIGLPLMLLDIDAAHRYAVLEMGANHAGEIAYLTSLASPDIVVITNAAAAHLEGFGSVEGVARAKAEILQGAKRPALAILNADDEYFGFWASLVADIDVLSFGLGDGADVCAGDIVADARGTRFRLCMSGADHPVRLPLVGEHNVRNACAAAAIATALGIPAAETVAALEAAQPVAGRLQPLAGLHGSTLYDDTYNANPVSVMAAGRFLAGLPGESWLVLGDMAELGSDSLRLHHELGEDLRLAAVDRVFAVGELSRETVAGFGSGAHWFESLDSLATTIAESLAGNINVLVKGSRSMRMERVVDVLRARQPIRREA